MEYFKKSSLVIRADADAHIGTGHLMRCLALAQVLKDSGGKVIFVTACQHEGLIQRLQDEGFDLHLLDHPYPDHGDWDYTKTILTAYPDAWVVVDGYHFDEIYQQQVKKTGHKLLVIDDMAHLKHYYADIVLNQNLHAGQLHYSCEPYTRLLFGTRYVLLRGEFFAWRGWKREIPEVAQRVLVTLGGGDPENHTLKVIQALQKVDIPGLEVTVVIGISNPHADVLEVASMQSRVPIRLIHDAKNMPELMAWADLAVSASGITSWELAFMGLPSLVLVLANNQHPIAQRMEELGAIINLGRPEDISNAFVAQTIKQFIISGEQRKKITRRAQKVVDGYGCARVMMNMQGEEIRLRLVCKDDWRLLWRWANDPTARLAAFSSDPISLNEHVSWFKDKFNDPNCFIFIGLNDPDKPVGQVRFDINEKNEAEIDVSIDKNKRGLGYGSLLISLSVEKIFNTSGIKAVHAFVKPENKASVRAFEKARFERVGEKIIKDEKAVHYIKIKDLGQKESR